MKRLLLTSLFIFWIVTFGYIMFGSKQLTIQKVHIQHNNYVPTPLIKELTNPLIGKHIISILFTSSIKKQLLNSFPQLKDIKFKIIWPNTILIDVQEKKEWAVFIINNQDKIVATDGSILNTIETNYNIQSVDNLIIVRGIHPDLFVNNVLNPKTVTAIKAIRIQIENHQNKVPIQYQFNKIHELSIIYNDELTIKLGKLEEIEKKFKQLNRFLEINTKPYNQIKYIDLRIPSKVVVNYAQGS